jgi:hypothetical protein
MKNRKTIVPRGIAAYAPAKMTLAVRVRFDNHKL